MKSFKHPCAHRQIRLFSKLFIACYVPSLTIYHFLLIRAFIGTHGLIYKIKDSVATLPKFSK